MKICSWVWVNPIQYAERQRVKFKVPVPYTAQEGQDKLNTTNFRSCHLRFKFKEETEDNE